MARFAVCSSRIMSVSFFLVGTMRSVVRISHQKYSFSYISTSILTQKQKETYLSVVIAAFPAKAIRVSSCPN